MAPDIYIQTCSLHPASINLNSSQQKWRGKSALKEYSGEENALEKLLHMEMSAGRRKPIGKMWLRRTELWDWGVITPSAVCRYAERKDWILKNNT